MARQSYLFTSESVSEGHPDKVCDRVSDSIVDLFLSKDYDTKKNMIADLSKPIAQEMVIQEINRYADSEFRYADESDEVAIENAVREMGRMEEAKKRYLKERKR